MFIFLDQVVMWYTLVRLCSTRTWYPILSSISCRIHYSIFHSSLALWIGKWKRKKKQMLVGRPFLYCSHVCVYICCFKYFSWSIQRYEDVHLTFSTFILLFAGKKWWREGSRFRAPNSPFCFEDGIEVGYNFKYT